MNPFSGTWIANIEKSRRHANHQFQSATLSFELAGDDVSLTHAGVNMAGKRESGKQPCSPDGMEHPVSQAPESSRLRDGWETSSRVGGEEGRVLVGKGTYAVSEDGRALTGTVAGTDAAGMLIEQVIVFDRE